MCRSCRRLGTECLPEPEPPFPILPSDFREIRIPLVLLPYLSVERLAQLRATAPSLVSAIDRILAQRTPLKLAA